MTREEEIRERLGKTTCGGWGYAKQNNLIDIISEDGAEVCGSVERLEDAIFIVHSCDDIAYLLDQNELLEKKLALCIEQRNSRIGSSDGMTMQRAAYDEKLKEITND